MFEAGRGYYCIIRHEFVLDHGTVPIIKVIVDRKHQNVSLLNKPEYQIQIFFERTVTFVNDGLAEFVIVVSSISFLAELAKGNKYQLTKTVAEVARSEGIKMMFWAALLNFVFTRTL